MSGYRVTPYTSIITRPAGRQETRPDNLQKRLMAMTSRRRQTAQDRRQSRAAILTWMPPQHPEPAVRPPPGRFVPNIVKPHPDHQAERATIWASAHTSTCPLSARGIKPQKHPIVAGGRHQHLTLARSDAWCVHRDEGFAKWRSPAFQQPNPSKENATKSAVTKSGSLNPSASAACAVPQSPCVPAAHRYSPTPPSYPGKPPVIIAGP